MTFKLVRTWSSLLSREDDMGHGMKLGCGVRAATGVQDGASVAAGARGAPGVDYGSDSGTGDK